MRAAGPFLRNRGNRATGPSSGSGEASWTGVCANRRSSFGPEPDVHQCPEWADPGFHLPREGGYGTRVLQPGASRHSHFASSLPAWCCRVFLAASGIAVVSCSTLSPLRNPTVEVGIDHPAGIGLNVTEVAFDSPQGLCSAEVVGGLTRRLVSNGVAVRSSMALAGASRSGRSLVLSLNDTVCDSEQNMSSREVERTRERTRTVDGEEETYEETYKETEFTFRTRFDAGVYVRASDPGTGGLVDARSVSRSRESSARGSGSNLPGFPSAGPLRDSATAAVEGEIARWLLPWTETVDFVFYNAEECGMDEAYAHLLRGDLPFALDASQSGIARCEEDGETEPQFRAAARYNAGMAHFIGGDHDNALRMLRTARTIDPENSQIARAVEAVLRARELEAEMREIHGGGESGDTDDERRHGGDPPIGSL